MPDDSHGAGGRCLPAFHVIDGEREVLERRLMWAILFDQSDKTVLSRRLTPAANSALVVDEPSE